MKCTVFPKTSVCYKYGPYPMLFKRQNALFLYLCRGSSLSATSQRQKNYLNGVLIKKSLLEEDLKLKGIIYFVFSREVKTTNQPEEKKNYRKVANNNGQLLGKRARYISHSSPIKIQKRKNCFE